MQNLWYLILTHYSQAARREKNPPYRETIPFPLYIVLIDLISVFLHVDNVQITYGLLTNILNRFFL